MRQNTVPTILTIAGLLAVSAYAGATECAPIKRHLKLSQVCGHVADVSGAEIPHAEVELLDDSFILLRQAVADEHGYFLVPNVSDGRYQMVVIAPGYGSSQRQPLTITRTNHKTTCHKPLKVTLNVGGISCGAVSK